MTALSVPVPTTFREVSDCFTAIAVGAPNFEFLNKHVSYVITLDMMFDSLRLGIDIVAGRTRSPEAIRFYQLSKDEVEIAYELYLNNDINNAQKSMFKAQHSFKQAGAQRSRKSSIKFNGENPKSMP